ncbi:uncharacterized protein TNCV_2976271 [Trichonephila clavipes]|nr:uncharacterized protein TNCV_2976271 [Trichonephila clavipes]
MFDSSSFVNPTSLAHADASRDVLPSGGIGPCLALSRVRSRVPLKTRRVGQRFTLNLPRAETSSRWCGVVVRRRGASSGVVHVTGPWFKITWFVTESLRVAEQCDVNNKSIESRIDIRDCLIDRISH